jgi:hypothetical protein
MTDLFLSAEILESAWANVLADEVFVSRVAKLPASLPKEFAAGEVPNGPFEYNTDLVSLTKCASAHSCLVVREQCDFLVAVRQMNGDIAELAVKRKEVTLGSGELTISVDLANAVSKTRMHLAQFEGRKFRADLFSDHDEKFHLKDLDLKLDSEKVWAAQERVANAEIGLWQASWTKKLEGLIEAINQKVPPG